MISSIRAFSEEANLRNLGRPILGRLTRHYSRELAEAGTVIPSGLSDNEFYRTMVGFFQTPEAIPNEMHDALYHIRELDNTRGEECIVSAVLGGRLTTIDLHADLSTADKTLLAWVENEPLVRSFLVQVGLDRSRSFLHFQQRGFPDIDPCDFEEVREGMQEAFSALCSRHGRREGVEIIPYVRRRQTVYVIKRTDPYRRTSKQGDDGEESLYFWPVAQDLVVYDHDTHQLRINVNTKWQKEGYISIFGQYLFGDGMLFEEASLYDLEPIRWRGRAILNGAAYGIQSIRLTQLKTLVDSESRDYRTRESADVFASYEEEGGIPPDERIVRAVFKLRLDGVAHERTVTIMAPNRAKYQQDHYAGAISQWLRGVGIVRSCERAAA